MWARCGLLQAARTDNLFFALSRPFFGDFLRFFSSLEALSSIPACILFNSIRFWDEIIGTKLYCGRGRGCREILFKLTGGFLKRIAEIFLGVLLICGQDVLHPIAVSLLG
jgi:hypothetical protein